MDMTCHGCETDKHHMLVETFNGAEDGDDVIQLCGDCRAMLLDELITTREEFRNMAHEVSERGWTRALVASLVKHNGER